MAPAEKAVKANKTKSAATKAVASKSETAMKTLGNLRPNPGSNVVKKRLGRGPGSGLGKQSARGGKGQTARKGAGIPAGFEGGQMPLYRRIPKRGFSNLFRTEYNVINLSALAKFEAGAKVTPDLLKSAGLLQSPGKPVKLLGGGSVQKAYTVVLHKVSASAKAAVEKAGGKVEAVEET